MSYVFLAALAAIISAHWLGWPLSLVGVTLLAVWAGMRFGRAHHDS